MESNKNNSNNNGDGEDKQPQLRNKRKLNQLANGGKPAGREEDQQEQEPADCSCSSKKSREERNDQDLELQHIVLPPQVTPQVQVTAEKETADEDEEQAEEEAEVAILPPMKIEMSKETWFDMLEFVGRRQLGQLVPQVGDRRFARIAQAFLHNYGRITLANICISGPQHRLIQHVVAVPENIQNFWFIFLSYRYLNTPVINLLQKFQQATLFGNVNLDLRQNMNTGKLLKALALILPSIDNINSIRGDNIAQLAALYNANTGMAMTMLKMTRFLDIYHDDYNFAPCPIAFIIHWLHTPRDDEKPRVLILPLDYGAGRAIDKISQFIDDTIKEEFATAKIPVCFFIRLFVRDTVDWHDSSIENGETKEKLVIKKVATTGSGPTYGQTMALISRYPLAADKHWIEANEREAINWDFDEQNGRICLGDSVRNAIDNGDGNNADGDDGQDDQRGRLPNSNYGDRDRAFGDRRGLGRALGFAKRGGFQGRGGAGGQGRGGGPGRGGGQGRGGGGPAGPGPIYFFRMRR